MDAREFLRMLANGDPNTQSEAKKQIPREFLKFDHCFMNLPVDAVEFLDCFIGAFKNCDRKIWEKADGTLDLPLIHVYGFTYENERQKALDYFVKRIGKAMQFAEFSESDVLCFHQIRDVSP